MTVALPPRPDWSQLIKSGCRVFVGGNAGVPYALIDDLIANSKAYSDIELVHMLALGDNRWAKEEYRQLFKVNTFLFTVTKYAGRLTKAAPTTRRCFCLKCRAYSVMARCHWIRRW